MTFIFSHTLISVTWIGRLKVPEMTRPAELQRKLHDELVFWKDASAGQVCGVCLQDLAGLTGWWRPLRRAGDGLWLAFLSCTGGSAHCSGPTPRGFWNCNKIAPVGEFLILLIPGSERAVRSCKHLPRTPWGWLKSLDNSHFHLNTDGWAPRKPGHCFPVNLNSENSPVCPALSLFLLWILCLIKVGIYQVVSWRQVLC